MLRHENVVELIEYFNRKQKIYLVFEYLDKNLLEVIEEKPEGLEEEQIKKIIFQILVALDFIHNHNVIHRDIKPENILLNKQHKLKLCDFGFARLLPSNTSQ